MGYGLRQSRLYIHSDGDSEFLHSLALSSFEKFALFLSVFLHSSISVTVSLGWPCVGKIQLNNINGGRGYGYSARVKEGENAHPHHEVMNKRLLAREEMAWGGAASWWEDSTHGKRLRLCQREKLNAAALKTSS